MKLTIIVVLTLIAISTGASAIEWTNVTCQNGNAFKIFNSTLNGDPVNRTETEVCGPLNCINSIGCVDPRDTPGELYLGIILSFIIISFLFGYLAMKIDNKKHFPIRLLFFNLCLIMILSTVLMAHYISLTFGHTGLANTTIITFYALFGIYFIILMYFIIELLRWFHKVVWNKTKNPDSSEDMEMSP